MRYLVFILITTSIYSCSQNTFKGRDNYNKYSVEFIDSTCSNCERIDSTGSGFKYVKKMGGIPFEFFGFDSLGNYETYQFCSSSGKPKYQLTFDSDLKLIKAEGSPLYIRRNECIKLRNEEVFIMTPSPPFFNVSLEFYLKNDSSDYKFVHEYSVIDDKPVLYRDTINTLSSTLMIVLKMRHSNYMIVDTTEIYRPICESGVVSRVAVTE